MSRYGARSPAVSLPYPPNPHIGQVLTQHVPCFCGMPPPAREVEQPAKLSRPRNSWPGGRGRHGCARAAFLQRPWPAPRPAAFSDRPARWVIVDGARREMTSETIRGPLGAAAGLLMHCVGRAPAIRVETILFFFLKQQPLPNESTVFALGLGESSFPSRRGKSCSLSPPGGLAAQGDAVTIFFALYRTDGV